jgi:hypothetical protein
MHAGDTCENSRRDRRRETGGERQEERESERARGGGGGERERERAARQSFLSASVRNMGLVSREAVPDAGKSLFSRGSRDKAHVRKAAYER